MLFQIEIWLLEWMKVEFHFEIRGLDCREVDFRVEIVFSGWWKVVFENEKPCFLVPIGCFGRRNTVCL